MIHNHGKVWLAKQIAIQIGLQVTSSSKVNTVIPLKWIEETRNLSNENNMLTAEMNNVEDPTPSDQSLNNQIDMGRNESIRRTSTRNRKAPSSMSKDFLW
jgi:hypothetical protein